MVESFIISAEPFGFSSSALISLRVNLFIVFLPCFRAAEPFGALRSVCPAKAPHSFDIKILFEFCLIGFIRLLRAVFREQP